MTAPRKRQLARCSFMARAVDLFGASVTQHCGRPAGHAGENRTAAGDPLTDAFEATPAGARARS